MREIQKDLREARKDLSEARKQEREARERVERLENAQASLRGEAPASARKRHRRVTRADVLDYLVEHPGSHYTEIAAFFGVPPNTIGSHLSAAKGDGQVENEREQWSVIKGKWPAIKQPT
jgi:DNA-binding transcriptional ArsR family regulator